MLLLKNIQAANTRYAPDFELRGVDNRVHHLTRYLERYRAVGVVLMNNNSGNVQLYVERLKKIQLDLQPRGFTLIGINANQDCNESLEEMRKFAICHQLNFPYLWDSSQEVTESFGVKTTPMSFLIDRQGAIRYQGAIDDNAQNSNGVKKHYFRNAALKLLKGQTISTPATEAVTYVLQWGY